MSRMGQSVRNRFIVIAFLWVVTPCVLFAAAGEPCLNDTPTECGVLNTLWRGGTAAGNSGDWYRNRDNDHAAINRSLFPQISDYTATFGFEREIVDAPRVVIGNASLGVSGLYGMVRYYGMATDFYGTAQITATKLYNQYRASQTYWYPAVDMTTTAPTARDMNTGMFPYANQSIGKSSSELDEVTKYFHALAAFKPAVKTKLIDEGLLIPTMQMIYRRTRVASDAQYLTGLAHPSAFGDNANEVAMINMAQAMDTTDIPPMIQLVVEEENFGTTSEIVKYNDRLKQEDLFTTPAAIGRIFRGTEQTKRMVVNASTSTDANGLSLTYHFAVLRGDPAHVRITPLNTEGSRVEIEIDYHHEAIDPDTGRLSALVVIGAFVNNGTYYSAPGFISSLSLHNETRSYDDSGLIQTIVYTDVGNIESSKISRNRPWDSDTYTHDFNRRITGWMRDAGGLVTQYTVEGSIQTSADSYGRPLTATRIAYPTAGDIITITVGTTWQDLMSYAYTNLTTTVDTALNQPLGVVGATISVDTLPENGSLIANSGSFLYTPNTGFTGVDIFTLREEDATLSEARIHKIRVAVGPTDTTAPATPTGVTIYGASSAEALVSWSHTTDNMEVYGYHIYRNGSLLGTSYTTTTFSDTTVASGASYTYTVTAFDDAGNESAASAGASGGSAALWGQDDFEDGNYTVADPTLINGLTWTVDSGSVQLATAPEQSGNWLKPGAGSAAATKIMPPASLSAPFLIEFNDAQQYAVSDMGLVFLYLDDNNYYSLEITRDVFALHRTMGGVKSTIGSATALKMQHTICSAKFAVQVAVSGDEVVVDVTKSEWTTYNPTVVSPASQSIQWADTNATAAATFTSGRIGFYQDLISSYNVAYYDNILISSLDGNGPVPPLQAQFSATPLSGDMPLNVTFTDFSTGIITNRFWDFGDGITTNTTSAGISHTYTSAGDRSVQLIVSDVDGANTNTQVNLIHVMAPEPPSASFSANPVSGEIPLVVSFTDSSTGTISNRAWDFGDGTTTNIAGTAVSHTYTGAGTYTVELIVSGAEGSSTNTQVDTISVTPPTPPSASFSTTPTSGFAPLIVSFTDTSSGTITTHLWDFGDGTTTNVAGTSVAHTYTGTGIYTVELIVSGIGGASTNTQANLINATEAPPSEDVVISAEILDQQVRGNGTTGTSLNWVNQQDDQISGAQSGEIVVPFELPDLEGDSINSANLLAALNAPTWQQWGNIDLYGIRYASSAAVLLSDYAPFSDSAGNGTKIMDNFYVSGSGTATYQDLETDAAGDAALAAWLTDQFTAGAVAGDYVFLRFQPDDMDAINDNSISFATADTVSETTPTLTIVLGNGGSGSTINDWRFVYFGTTNNTGNAADDADPANDGYPNLLKYALGLVPTNNYDGSPIAPHAQVQDPHGFTYTFTHDTGVSDATLMVEGAFNLVSNIWINIDPLDPANQVDVQADTPEAGIETITIKDTDPNATNRFLRLKATRP